MTEKRTSQDLLAELEKTKRDKRKKDQALLEAWGEAEDLRSAVLLAQQQKDDAISNASREADDLHATIQRVREEKSKAIAEGQGLNQRLEERLKETNGFVSRLQAQLALLEHSSDKSIFDLRQQLDMAQQEEARAKEEMESMRGRLDEAEFAHRALKEGGARLARDLGEKERRIIELEKAMGLRRGGKV
ncbi:hypothetical protein BD324DRAFT_639730 [Kockovaella imperatae]|uniref:Uncharacterized protein n=1 Tax=Kockovaella imperatae TaxID=4999 RepID=A0A1Y1U5W0_9TREE|nr:hypothetical protein BD324DRAFT_639730 [Kockovaella imperatae]ORX33423.1 hypothetical protein BD324DRAFT_639730 [Kockovaella imperatae]